MHRNSRAGRTQRGNILFLILLAVVLFAALSYAVTQSMRVGGKDGGSERAKASASAVLNYMTLIEQTIQRLTLVNGCTLSQISFQNNVDPNYTNTGAPSSKKCHIFDPSGGGLTWQTPPAGVTLNSITDPTPWYFTLAAVVNIGTHQDTVSDRCVTKASADRAVCVDLVGALFDVSKGFCEAVNDMQNIQTIPTEIGPHTFGLGFNGILTRSHDDIGFPLSNNDEHVLNGKNFGCYVT